MDKSEIFLKKKIEKYEDELIKSNEKFLKKISSVKIPSLITHYTNDEGLRGILSTRELWLTNVFNLNDPSEIKFGVNRAIEILNKLSKNGTSDQRYFADRFSHIYRNSIERAAHFFACSFSKNSDELGQWRAYGDDGRGYSIEFKTELLEKAFELEHQPVPGTNSVFDVRYNNAEIVKIQTKLVSSAFPLINLPQQKQVTVKQKNNFLEKLSSLLAMYVLQSSLYFKHEGYRAEEEYRFLQTFNYLLPVPNEKHRFRKDEIVKYRVFNWNDAEQLPIKRVVIGPAADKSKAFKFVSECLSLYGYKGIAIGNSDIPYRSQKI